MAETRGEFDYMCITEQSAQDGLLGVAAVTREIKARAQQGKAMLRQTISGQADEQKLAKGLAWFSLGLGLVEFLTPQLVARLTGQSKKNCGLIRLFGLREIAHGISIFSQGKRPANAVWSRVAGDLLDMTALGFAFASPKSNKIGVALAAANVAGVTALDILTADQLSKKSGDLTDHGAVRVQKSLFINKAPEEVYQFWRDFERFPTFMLHLVSVRNTSGGRTHWTAKGPAGTTVDWEAEITQDWPNEVISWRSRPGSAVQNTGSVSFRSAPGNRGTIVFVELEYKPLGGMLGASVAKIFREDPLQQMKDDLRRFKQIIETGEIVKSDASPEGAGRMIQRPAQPSASGPIR
jgi:uncharacterized membrane protein